MSIVEKFSVWGCPWWHGLLLVVLWKSVIQRLTVAFLIRRIWKNVSGSLPITPM